MTMRRVVESLVARIKGDPDYVLGAQFTDAQLAIVLWHRGVQYLRGIPLRLRARGVHGAVFRGRRAVVEHARQLTSGPGLILEDGAFVNALSEHGIVLGRNVTVARGASLVCTGVLARLGSGIRIGNRCGIGVGCFLGGQGGIVVGDDVIIGPGARIFSEDHHFNDVAMPIRAQGERRLGVNIGSDVWIGAGVTIVDGVTVGNGCVIAAGAVVTRSLPDMSIAAGVPARVIRSRQPGEDPAAAGNAVAPALEALAWLAARERPPVQ
ncbi:MAG: acyltransferase [Gemmatimonadaceae bacterium]